VGTFFAISTRLQQNIRQLDALSLAVGKRVVELDATIAAFSDATDGLGDTAEKLTGMEERQVKLDGKFETKMEDLSKLFTKMPEQIAGQVNGQSEKSLDAKLQNLQKSIQAVEAKMQALSAKAAAPTAAPPTAPQIGLPWKMAVPTAPAAAPIEAPDKVRCSVLLIFEHPAARNTTEVMAIIFFMGRTPSNMH
jgi:septal ring factor EnvC (AmiA/AmiB activator)